jgi:hypothetical protein
MSRVVVLQALVMISCGTQGPARFDVTVDTSAAPAAAIVYVYYASGPSSSTPIATPDILAGNAPAAVTATVWSGLPMGSAGVHGTTLGFGLRTSTGFDHPMYVGVVALSQTGIVAGAWSGPLDHPEDSSLLLELDPALLPEAWGRLSDGSPCFRLNTGTATVYITQAEDPDCDGLTGAQDTQPYAFCDPTAMSGPPRDACH